MKFLKFLRELVWPLLEPDDESLHVKEIDIDKITISSEEYDTAFDLALQYYKDEKERNGKIESKSTVFIGSFGVAATIIIAVTKDIINSNTFSLNINNFFTLLTLTLIVVYLSRALWFSIKALERRGFSSLNCKDFIDKSNNVEYKKNIIFRLINCTRKNYNVINSKADYMAMAQEYFKRAVVIIAVLPIIVFTNVLFSNIADINNSIKQLNNILGQVQPNAWIFISFGVLTTVNLVISIIALSKAKRS